MTKKELRLNNLKECQCCHQILPRTVEHFYLQRDSFSSKCKPCYLIHYRKIKGSKPRVLKPKQVKTEKAYTQHTIRGAYVDKKQKHYLSNKELYMEIIVSKAMGKLTNEALNMLMLLARQVHRKFHYSNPMDGEDTLQNAMYQIIKNWQCFDELNTHNAFAYYTEVAKRGHSRGWRELKRGIGMVDGQTYGHVSLDTGGPDGEGIYSI